MAELDALKAAIELLHMPTKAGWYRSAPLPVGMTAILALAAGDPLARQDAATATGRPDATLVSAASFFIEQILLHDDNDSFRTLGGTAETDLTILRRNMAYLLRWLHPDHAPDGDRAVFATRVTAAWETIKTPERLKAYAALHAKPTSNQPADAKPHRTTKKAVLPLLRRSHTPLSKAHQTTKGAPAAAATTSMMRVRSPGIGPQRTTQTLFRRALARLGFGLRQDR